jgi:DNA helicase-2/ATP-dependent DNA helicase PcrA
VLIIAGPGSGKTFTLVERVVRLIQTEGARPETLLVATFTEKAAQELTTRISNRLLELDIPFNINEMYVGTFHSICLRFLKEFREHTRLKRSFNLLDQFDQQYFLYQRLYDFKEIDGSELITGEDRSGRWQQSTQLMKWLNKATEECLNIDALLDAAEPEMRVLAACYQKYQSRQPICAL